MILFVLLSTVGTMPETEAETASGYSILSAESADEAVMFITRADY